MRPAECAAVTITQRCGGLRTLHVLQAFVKAVGYHTIAAWTLIGLWVFAIFWHFTTGEWKQYIQINADFFKNRK